MASSDPDTAGGLTESARANRAFWDGYSTEYQALHHEALGGDPAWGLWRIPDEELGILELVAAGERVDQYETARRRLDGTKVDILLSVSPIRDLGGRVVGVSMIGRPVAARTHP